MMHRWLIWLMVMGGLGTVSRYALSHAIDRFIRMPFSIGTIAVNVLGCFLFGIVYDFCDRYVAYIPSTYRFYAMTGFLGGFTTFSAYAGQTMLLFQTQRYDLAFINIVASNLFSFIAVLAGIACSRIILK